MVSSDGSSQSAAGSSSSSSHPASFEDDMLPISSPTGGAAVAQASIKTEADTEDAITTPEAAPLPATGTGSPPTDVISEVSNSSTTTSTLIAATPQAPSTTFAFGLSQSVPHLSTMGYLSSRRNAAARDSFSTPAASQTQSFGYGALPPLIGHDVLRTPTNNRTPSSVRLSLSLDGKAELISSNVSPSRPQSLGQLPANSNSRRPRAAGFQRSQSALTFGSTQRRPLPESPTAPRLPTGRSRDARQWEFCCDPDTRDDLIIQADDEASGSAVAAITLLRSTSGSALKTNQNKRNAPSTRNTSTTQGKKPKLGRAASSVARLQSDTDGVKPSDKGRPSLSQLRSPSGESDKENWIPIDNGSNASRQPPVLQKPARRKVLQDNTMIPTLAMDFGRPNKRKTMGGGVDIFEDDDEDDVEGDQEVEKFMRGEISPGKKGDLDCVQGLLSLSQGMWR